MTQETQATIIIAAYYIIWLVSLTIYYYKASKQ